MPVPGSKEERFFQQEQLRLYVDAPALQLCWFARDLSRRNGWEGSRQAVRRVAVLAMELMGTYSLGPDPSIEAGEAYGLAQLTTKDALAQQLGELSNIDGLVLARKAVARAGEKAASPLEALFFLYLTLPPRLGGLGISQVLLNHPLDADELRRVGAAHTMLTPDLWLQDLGIVIECDSRLSHDTGAFAVAHVAPATSTATRTPAIVVLTVVRAFLLAMSAYPLWCSVRGYLAGLPHAPSDYYCAAWEGMSHSHAIVSI
jgi:hypothetical protein